MRLAHLLDDRYLQTAPGTAPSRPPHHPAPADGHTGPDPALDAAFDAVMQGMLPCRTNDPELWFAEHAAQVEQAKALCRTCPLIAGCLAGAVERAEPWGVWGGEVFVDGVVVARKRGRGRPRKTETAPVTVPQTATRAAGAAA